MVGRIGKPHGLRGEVTIDVRTDEPDRRFADGVVLAARPPAGSASPLRAVTVESTRWHQQVLLARFAEIGDRNAAEAARGIVLHATLDAGRVPGGPRGVLRPPAGRPGGLRRRRRASRRADRRHPRRGPGPADDPHARRARHVGAVRGRPRARGRRRRRPDRHRRPAGPRGAVPRHRSGGVTVRVDVVTIFPAYLDPLALSLPGKARERGLLDVRVHDLRQWAHDRHRTVDDTPYGGGAGMVMKPEPWGEAFDALAGPETTVVVPTPAGRPFTQVLARELATRPHLLVACGRYEGIDQRVLDHAATRPDVVEVLRGLAGRLRPQRRRGRRAGDHRGRGPAAARASWATRRRWRRSRTRTACWSTPSSPSRRPGAASRCPTCCCRATMRAIAAWRHDRVGRAHGRAPSRPAAPLAGPRRLRGPPRRARPTPASCSRSSGRAGCRSSTTTRGCTFPRCTSRWPTSRPGSRATRCWSCAAPSGWSPRCGRRRAGDEWHIGRLMVAPDLQGRGLGRWLLARIEEEAPPGVTTYTLVTGARSTRNQRLYKRAGYRLRGPLSPDEPGVVRLTKPRRPTAAEIWIVPDFGSPDTPGQTTRSSGTIPNFAGWGWLWQTCPSVQSVEGQLREVSCGGSASGTCHRGSLAPPATTTGPTSERLPFRG